MDRPSQGGGPKAEPRSKRPDRHAEPTGADRRKAIARNRFSRFLSYYRPHRKMLVADLLSAALVAATAVALPLIANAVINRLPGLEGDPNALNEIALWGGLMLGVFVVQAFATFFVDYQGHVMGARIEAQVRRELFAHCQTLSFSFFDRQRTGQLMSRISNDSLWLGELFHHGPEDAAIGILKFIGAMTVIFLIDPVVALLVLTLVPFAAFYALHFNGRLSTALRLSKERIGAVNERVEDALSGVRVVQSFAREADEARRFEVENQSFFESRRAGYRGEAMLWIGMESFAQLVTIVVITAGAARILVAGLSPADLLTLLLSVGVLVDPVRRLDNFVRLWQEGYTGFVRAMELLEIAPQITERPDAEPLEAVRGRITFDNVRFGYEAGVGTVFEGLDLDIAPGTFVALVGPSGGGKSTLCALVPRFYDVLGGAVRIDGHDVRDVTLASLRRAIGVVAQDVYLFSGSVADNLRYGRPGASEADVVAAAKAANAHEFILALPQGYDTDVGQRGVRLSGGQKQRLTIARAFLKDPPILIFDEATSALDTESERAVQEALRRLARGRTMLVIAHRLSTVRHADRIVVLADGAVAEDGTHESLLAQGGLYARLNEVQARI